VDITSLAQYEGSKKALQLTITKKSDGSNYVLTNVFASVLNSSGEIAIPEVECMIIENKASFVLDTATLDKGKYFIKWRILKNEYISYHKTVLQIQGFI
jgi:hypothetical protein